MLNIIATSIMSIQWARIMQTCLLGAVTLKGFTSLVGDKLDSERVEGFGSVSPIFPSFCVLEYALGFGLFKDVLATAFSESLFMEKSLMGSNIALSLPVISRRLTTLAEFLLTPFPTVLHTLYPTARNGLYILRKIQKKFDRLKSAHCNILGCYNMRSIADRNTSTARPSSFAQPRFSFHKNWRGRPLGSFRCMGRISAMQVDSVGSLQTPLSIRYRCCEREHIQYAQMCRRV